MAERVNGGDGRSPTDVSPTDRSPTDRIVTDRNMTDGNVTDRGDGRSVTGRSLTGRALRVAAAPGTDADPAATALVELLDEGQVRVDGTQIHAALDELDLPRARLSLTGEDGTTASHQVLVIRRPDPGRAMSGVSRLEVVVDGWRFELDVDWEKRSLLRERATSARADATRGGPQELRAIIPGRVVSVEVAEGDVVKRGGRLLVLEAMKMQNELKAPRDGTVTRVAVGPGQTVELGDLLVVIE